MMRGIDAAAFRWWFSFLSHSWGLRMMCFARSYLKVLFSVGEGQLDRILGMMGEVQMTKMERLYCDILAFRHCRKEDLPSHVSPSL
jgi:hypothetical protein